MKTFRNFFVWTASVDVAVRISEFADVLIRRRRFALADQIQRSSLSIPSNIAEGLGRFSKREQRRFYTIARGSLFELETQLEVSRRRRFLSEKTYAELHEQIAKISAGLSKLIKSG